MSTTPGTIANTPAPSHSANEVSNTRLYLGNLPRNVTKADVEAFFSKHGTGEILDIKLMNGFGFIEYRDAMDARDVVPAFHGTTFMGERLTVQFARGRTRETGPGGPGAGPGNNTGGGYGGYGYSHSGHDRPPPRPRRTAHRMAISGLPNDTSWQDLKDFARRSGLEVVYSETTRFGDGTVEFESAQDLATAIEKLNNTEFRDKVVTCNVSAYPDLPPRDRGRSRSPPPGRRPYGMPPRDDYDRRGPPPPPRGYGSPRRDSGGGGGGGGGGGYRDGYRDRSPPPRRDYYDDRMRYPSPPPRRGPPPIDDYPPPSRRYDDPYRREYPPNDPYVNGRGGPYERPPPPRDFHASREAGYPREGGYPRDYDRRYW